MKDEFGGELLNHEDSPGPGHWSNKIEANDESVRAEGISKLKNTMNALGPRLKSAMEGQAMQTEILTDQGFSRGPIRRNAR